ncbi:MAG: hypothetical protein AB8H79_12375 [Myxococcota bacterium]
MLRVLLSLAVLSTVACDRPEAKDGATVFSDLILAEGGEFALNAYTIQAGVDAEVRQMDTTLTATMGGIWTEGTVLDLDMGILEGLTEVAEASRTSPDDDGTAEWAPDFKACIGPAYTLREDDGCDYAATALVVGDRSYTLIMGFGIETQAPEDWEGDKDQLDVYIQASEAEAE